MIKIIKLCIACVLFGLMLSIVSIVCGCGSASMFQREFYPDGTLKSEKEVRVKRTGSGKLRDVDIDVVLGKAKIGSREGDIGGLGTVLEKAIDRIPVPPMIP